MFKLSIIFSIVFLLALTSASHLTTVNNYNQVTPCEVCTKTVEVLTYDIEHYNKTIHDIAELTKDLCQAIGGPGVGEECTFIVNNLEEIINMVEKGLSPTNVCIFLHLCYPRYDKYCCFYNKYDCFSC